jgi:hypothetical protein
VLVDVVQVDNPDRVSIEAVDFDKVVASLHNQNYEFNTTTDTLTYSEQGADFTYQRRANNFGLFLLLAWRNQGSGFVIRLYRVTGAGTSAIGVKRTASDTFYGESI